MSLQPEPIQAPGRVLSTLNLDGSRHWIRPRPSPGPWHRSRQRMAYTLMVVFFLIPYLRINGGPLVLLDFPRRQFTLFGHTFLSTDTLPFMLVFVSIGITIFLVTALFGRVWCGWGCPQTVYMEFLFRPIEHWIEGGPRGATALDRRRGLSPRRLLKLAIFGGLAMFLSHTFLAYFVGIDTLSQWVQRSPAEHPTSFFIMAGVTGLIFFDFAYFREQTCLVACPYGRLQSVLLDRRSLVVGYDPLRGEPRAKGTRPRPTAAGDCIDCTMCVQTCPTGIDIRDGLQMECIHCTQCMDACDAVMAKVGKPLGLIRYSSRDELEGTPRPWMRPRVLIYPAVLALALGALIWNLAHTAPADITLLRGSGAPFTVEPDGNVANPIRIKIANRSGRDRRYTIALEDARGARLVTPFNPFPVPAGRMLTTTVFVLLPPGAFTNGTRPVTFRIGDGERFSELLPYQLVGPERPELGAGGARGSEEPGASAPAPARRRVFRAKDQRR